MHIDATCSLCQGDIESFDHLFIQCPSTKKIWALAHSHQWITTLISCRCGWAMHSILPPFLSQHYHAPQSLLLTLEHMEGTKCYCFQTENVQSSSSYQQSKKSKHRVEIKEPSLKLNLYFPSPALTALYQSTCQLEETSKRFC